MEPHITIEDLKMLKNPNTEKFVNEVSVTAFYETVEAVKADPSLAKFSFSLHNAWLGGGKNRSAINAFYGAGEKQSRNEPFFYDNDEPPVLLGQDSAPNPAEFLLHALAGCITTTIVYHAAARDIEIKKIDSDAFGEMDARPFLDIPGDAKPGYHFIKVHLKVKTTADAETLKELGSFSPIYQTINGKTPVEILIETY